MKKFIVTMLLFSFLLASCSTTDQLNIPTVDTENQSANENELGVIEPTVESPAQNLGNTQANSEPDSPENPPQINLPIVGVAEPTSQSDDPEVGSGITEPQQVDDAESGGGVFVEGPITIDSAEVVTEASDMLRVFIIVKGNLPTPCNVFSYSLSQPDLEGNINVRIYSLVDAGAECEQTPQAFEEQVDLGFLPSGKYSISINGNLIQELEF